MSLRHRLRRSRLTPTPGPAYDLFEVALVIAFGALTVYALRTPNASAAEAWLTEPGQTAAGYAMTVTALVAAALAYRTRWLGASAWIVAVIGITWALTLGVGLFVAGYRPGSAFFLVLWLLFAQLARKAWGRHVVERDFADFCTVRGDRR